MSGFLLIDKPESWTSHDVVGYTRKLLREYNKKVGLPAEARRAKVGHAGTLDPFATGLLIVGIGREATKRIDEFKALPKTYTARIRLGAISDTQDSTGAITEQDVEVKPTKEDVLKTLASFIGKQTQIPPMHSAKKVGGKKLYELARKGIEIERQPHEIEIFDIKLLDYSYPNVDIEVDCTAGTYIRTLAADIGEALGTGAYCEELRRTRIGTYDVEHAIEPKKLTSEAWAKNIIHLDEIE